MADRYIPRLNNYYLDIVRVRDGFENAIAVHEYSYSKRNELEHTGQKTRKIDVECIFSKNPTPTEGWNLGTLVAPTFEEHFFFIDLITEDRNDLTFAHPNYGELVGKVSSLAIDADDTIETAYIKFTFLQHIETEEATYNRYVIPEMEEEFRAANTTLTDKLEAEETAASNAVSWTAQATTYIGTLDAYLSSLTSPATSLMYQINYGTSTPGAIMEALNGAIDRIVQFYTTSRDAPASFINNLIVGVRDLKATLSGADAERVHIMGAARVAYEAGVILDEDDSNAREVAKKEAARSFDAEGNYTKVDTLPATMTLNELDNMLAELKTLMDEAVQIDRNYRSLQVQAARLQTYVNKIKFDRERIETKSITSPRSMHLVALNAGLSYQSAERLIKLNPDIKNPNFTYGDIDVLVPAG